MSTGSSDLFDSKKFRSALGTFATGVTIVTTYDVEHGDVGMTANSFNSVSLDPPLVLWSLAKSSGSLNAFMRAECFAVHILSSEQQPLSDLFARRGEDKFAGLQLERGPENIPLLPGCSARFECRIRHRYEGGDHEILVGEVIHFESFESPPLAFWGGKYAVTLPRISNKASDSSLTDGSFSRNSLSYLTGATHFMFDKKIRELMSQRQLNHTQFYTLSALGNDSPMLLKDLQRLLDIAGLNVQEGKDSLVDLGLISLSDEDDGLQLAITDAGRELMIEISAVVKALEEDALAGVDYAEAQLLHQVLRRVLRNLWVL